MKTLMMPKGLDTIELIEGHPIGISKIIKGDLRERTRIVNGLVQKYQSQDGEILYDSLEFINRPWFILVYESGKRVID